MAVSHIQHKLASSLRETVGDGKGHPVAFTGAELYPAASADGGQTWEEDFDLKQRLRGGACGAGKLLGVSNLGEADTSKDGKSLKIKKINRMNDGGSLMNAACTGRTWVLVGNDNSTWYSAGGAKWSQADAKGLYLERVVVK